MRLNEEFTSLKVLRIDADKTLRLSAAFSFRELSRYRFRKFPFVGKRERADDANNAISICKDIAHVLSTRGFHLRKWNSNSTEFLAQFSEHSSHDARVEFSKDSNGKF
ncbi:hypothetical protein TNCV_2643611 [Trichonephila clavipes]|nr:hypothetical protein TNCV_2643611 [Trichonephila clavipes]